MPPKNSTQEIHAIAAAIFHALRKMDAQCPQGLCGYKSISPYAGKKGRNEAAMTWGITEELAKQWRIEQRERRYPQTRIRCDRVLQLADDSLLWLEVKHAWRTFFENGARHNAPFFYNGYFSGAHHTHSVAGDFEKLERITREHGRYSALLVVGFDGLDDKMSDDMKDLAHREKLSQRGWRLISDSWATRQSNDCWHRCWFAWRENQ